jgi:hypothetical protein
LLYTGYSLQFTNITGTDDIENQAPKLKLPVRFLVACARGKEKEEITKNNE